MLSYNETHLFQNMVQTYFLTTMTKTIAASTENYCSKHSCTSSRERKKSKTNKKALCGF